MRGPHARPVRGAVRHALRAVPVLLSLAVVVAAPADAAGDDRAALKAEYGRPHEIPFPASNPFTPEAALLGRTLFFDARISGSGSLACASCHNPSFGWEDGLKLGHGDGLRDLGRHSPSILDAAWGGPFFWDGRAPTLEAQALGPIGAAQEMHGDLTKLPARLGAIQGYRPMFERAYPGKGITLDTIAAAIATFERTVSSSGSPFDAWLNGDDNAMPESAKRGFVLFTGKAACVGCHSGWRFTDAKFHDIGLPGDDVGRAAIAPDEPEAMHGFKTPTLRNVARRAPYMHDGSLPDLAAVMAHYISGGVDRPSRSAKMTALKLSHDEVADLTAFLESLSDPAVSFPAPTLPN